VDKEIISKFERGEDIFDYLGFDTDESEDDNDKK
jgi:hypothetical protein